MTSLLAVYDRDGKFWGVCGAKCYDAMHPLDVKGNPGKHGPCACICGGKNHSVGANRAMLNCERGVGKQPADLEAFARLHGLEAANLTVIDRLRVRGRKASTIAKARLHPDALVAKDDLLGRLYRLGRQGRTGPVGGAAGRE
jgi:hypothetical protein